MKNEHEEIRYSYRLPPCPMYDVAGMESWLGELAEQGLLLCEDGFWFGIATFRHAPAQRMTYRLEAVPRRRAFDDNTAPDEEAQTLAAQYGWEYVTRRGEFDIYRTDREDARELNTDPRVQALALRAVRARQRDNLLIWLFWLILYPLLRGGAALYRAPLLTAVTLGTPLAVFGTVIPAWLFARTMISTVQLSRMYRRLRRGETLPHRKDWQARARRYQVMSVVRTVLTVVWIVWLGVVTLHLMAGTGEVTWDEYLSEQDIPFATVADIAATQGQVTDARLTMSGFGNTVRAWGDILAPRSLDACHIAEVTLADGRMVTGGLYVEYHETAAPWIAAQLAREYHALDRREKNYEPLSLTLDGADTVIAYRNNIHMPTVVIQVGTRIIRASFHPYSQSMDIPPEVWAQAICDSIQAP